MALKHPAPPRRLFVIGCAVVMLAALVGLWPLIRSALRSNGLGLQAIAAAGTPTDAVGSFLTAETNSPREQALRAMIAARQGNYSEAIAYQQQALTQPERSDVWWLQLGGLYRAAGELQQAEQAILQLGQAREAAAINCQSRLIYYPNPKEADFWCPFLAHFTSLTAAEACLVGQYYTTVKQPEAAGSMFQQALQNTDVSADCFFRYGELLQSQQDYPTARSLFERAFEQEAHASYLLAIGSTYNAEAKPEQALQKYQEAYQLAPFGQACADALRYTGGVYYYTYQDFAQAAEYFERAIRCNNKVDVSVYWLLANSQRQLGHGDLALQAYEQMQQRLQGSAYLIEWRHEYASYLLASGKVDDALRIYRTILADNPNDPVAQEALNHQP